ncbi:efflux RND transporter permease subunit [Magnetospira sp. QH-2]|uniref:efflux RND transporter permease subunit n=1 Tax=Magnetospira sp. (strain QH-2) TaxID=1288970 RepID=UPI0003E81AB2|nr:efflux RND transporter permease subunit [Magnetospira sp. QH-2]CCQ74306.1 Acriflavin resistance protein [Magnetospira sp. QH-2]
MKKLIDAAVHHSRTVLSTLVLILVSGAYAYSTIPKEADPDINIPIIYVSTTHDGISPEDADRLLVRPLEQELRSIEGIKEMRSTGYEGGANVVLEFEAGFDADRALDDVRQKVDLAKPELPEDSDEPSVHEVNFSLFPVIAVILAGDVPERTLLKLARELQDDIEGISSVLEAEIAGDRDELVEVIVDPVKIEGYGLSTGGTVSAIAASNLLVAAGAQDTGKGRFSIKVPGLFENVSDILNMPLGVSGDSVVTVRDVAEVRRTFVDPTGFARVNGALAVTLEVKKRTGQNIIETIEAVRAAVAEAQKLWPAPLQQAVKISFSQDKSEQIRDMLKDLQNNVIAAVVLVMVVVIAALGPRTAALVGVAIPGSFLTGILVLWSLGMTINIVVLFSLILAVGMLVDGAIVVTEYADRKMSDGTHRRQAYALAAKRMSWPITASTATTLAAFLPLVFWPGVVGEFMKFLPITLLATLAASLFMALIFVPTLGSQIGKPGSADPETMKHLAAGDSGDIHAIPGFTGAYLRLLGLALNHPAKVLMLALGLLVGVQVVYANFGKGVEFFPEVEPEVAIVQVRARGNLSIWEQKEIMGQVESRILDMTEIETFYARTGQSGQSEEAEDIIGTVLLEFADWDERRKADVILEEIKQRTADLAGVIIDARKQEEGPPVGKPIQMQVTSSDAEVLDPTIDLLRAHLETVEGVTGIEDSRPLPGIDWELSVDRAQAAKYGINVQMVGSAVQLATTGIKLGDYRPDDSDDEIDIRARYPEKYRTLKELDNLRIMTDAGGVPLGNFVERKPEPKVGAVNRIDGDRVMTVKADVLPDVLPDEKVKELREWLKTAPVDPRADIVFKGEDEEQRKAEEFLGRAFLVALFIMAIILVTQFNSFYSAFLILSAVIMSTIGVFIGLLVTGQPFGIVMSGIGVIALAGIVVNNNIVLIDTHDRLMEVSGNARDAILRTGAQRLRPVLLTTVTTILGLMPMVFRLNIDFLTREVTVGAPATQWWTQLATAIVFGLGFSTLLTLVVTPSALMVRANVKAWRDKRRRQAPTPVGASSSPVSSGG